MMLRLLLMLSLIAFALPVYAGALYKWKDAAGMVHFTDNPNNVPAKYRKDKPLIMGKGLPNVKNPEKGRVHLPRSEGARLWANICSECHSLGKGRASGLKDLSYLAVNRVSKFSARVEEIFPDLKYAVSGRTSDMDEVDISDDELRAVAQYIIDSR